MQATTHSVFTTTSPSTHTQRYTLQVNELYKRYKLQLKALNALQDTWKRHLEDLKIKAVLRIQRGYRARKARIAAKEKAQEQLQKKREARKKRIEVEARLRRRREADAAKRRAAAEELARQEVRYLPTPTTL